MRELFGLLFDGADDSWIAVTEAGDGQSAEKVQIAIAIRIVEMGALTAHERQRHAAIIVDQIGVREFDDFRVIHDTRTFFPPAAAFSTNLACAAPPSS